MQAEQIFLTRNFRKCCKTSESLPQLQMEALGDQPLIPVKPACQAAIGFLPEGPSYAFQPLGQEYQPAVALTADRFPGWALQRYQELGVQSHWGKELDDRVRNGCLAQMLGYLR